MSYIDPRTAIINILESIDLQDGIHLEQTSEKIGAYFSISENDSTELETVILKMKEGEVVNIASSKLFNLKFRIKDLFLETLKASITIKSSMQDWLALTLIVLEFLQKISGLMEYPLSKDEARVLLEMYKLENEKVKITVDRLFSGLTSTFSEVQILKSLDLLEKLSCIQYGTEQIKLVETIIFVQE